MRTGETLSLYTLQPPKKIFPRMKEHMIKDKGKYVTKGLSCKLVFGNNSVDSTPIQLNSGYYSVLNDRITIIQPAQANEYRYDFISVRRSQLPWYKQADETDHLLLDWQGFRIDPEHVEHHQAMLAQGKAKKVENTLGFESRDGYLKMTFKSVMDPKFTFIEVPEFDMGHRSQATVAEDKILT